MPRTAQLHQDEINRATSLDWDRIAGDRDSFGCATTGPLLSAPDCKALSAS